MGIKKQKKTPKHLKDNRRALKAFSWCLRNDIKAYPVLVGTKYKITVENAGEVIISPNEYERDEWSNKIWEIYIHYYDKNAKSRL